MIRQYADCSYEGEAQKLRATDLLALPHLQARVVSQSEFRSRELVLDLDDAACAAYVLACYPLKGT